MTRIEAIMSLVMELTPSERQVLQELIACLEVAGDGQDSPDHAEEFGRSLESQEIAETETGNDEFESEVVEGVESDELLLQLRNSLLRRRRAARRARGSSQFSHL
jgi:hypothetical protein